MADYVFLTLLVLHVGFVVAWLGASLVGNIVLLPFSSKLSDQARSEFMKVMLPQVFRYNLICGGIALIAGAALYGYINFVSTAFATSSSGLPYIQAGAAVGLVITIIVNIVGSSAQRRIAKLGAQIAQSKGSNNNPLVAEIASLQRRMQITLRSGVVILTIAFILMIVGTNIA